MKVLASVSPLCFNPQRELHINTLSWIFFILQAHWNNSPQRDMSPHSDTLSWFRANQSLLFLLNDAWLTEKLFIWVKDQLSPVF